MCCSWSWKAIQVRTKDKENPRRYGCTYRERTVRRVRYMVQGEVRVCPLQLKKSNTNKQTNIFQIYPMKSENLLKKI